MANVISIAGKSGSGKSTSIRRLDPKTTFIIAVTKKDLPFKGADNKYTSFLQNKETGNHITIHKAKDIVTILKFIHAKRPEIKTIVIDDIQYIMSKQAMSRANEKNFDKHVQIAADYNLVIETALALRDDLFIFTLTHVDEEIDKNGTIISAKIKTLGKMLDNVVTVDGLYTWNLYSTVLVDETTDKVYRVFQTNDPSNVSSCKTPAGAFDKLYIPNDLQLVIDAVKAFKLAEDDDSDEFDEIPDSLNVFVKPNKNKSTETQSEVLEETSSEEESDLGDLDLGVATGGSEDEL